ncbi:MAG: hypothetical protein ACI857_000053 [Arenicella sp.]|jgi:hypothetical protein
MNMCKSFKVKFLVAIICFLSTNIFCQSIESDSTKKNKLTVFPLIGYTPETSLAFGLITNFMFFTADSSEYNRPSNIQPVFIVSIKKQFLFYGKTNLYFKNGFKYSMRLDVLSFPNSYFGIGNTSLGENEETISPLSVLIKPVLVKEFNGKVFIGGQVDFDAHKISFDSISKINMDQPLGINGGIVFGIGSKFQYDSRDDILYPTKGAYIDFDIIYYMNAGFTDYEYFNIKFNAKKYVHIKNEKNIIAMSIMSNNNFGNSPYYRYPLIGGANRIRGLYFTRFTDKFAYFSQYEYRRHIWKRFSAAGFFAFGQVSDKFMNFNIKETKCGGGLGLRFQLTKNQKLNLRLDYAWASDNSSGFYLSLGEAF